MTIELIRLVQRGKLGARAAYKQALAMGGDAFKALCREDPDLERSGLSLDEYAEGTLDYLRRLGVREHEEIREESWRRLGVYAGKLEPVKLIETGMNTGVVYTDWLHTRHVRLGLTAISRRRTVFSPEVFREEFVLRRDDTAVLFTLVEALDPSGGHVAYLLFVACGETPVAWRHSARDDVPVIYDSDDPPSPAILARVESRHTFGALKNLQTDSLFGAVSVQHAYRLLQSWITLVPAHAERDRVLSALEAGRDGLVKSALSSLGASAGAALGGAVGGILGKALGQAVGAAIAKMLGDAGIQETLTILLPSSIRQGNPTDAIPVVSEGESPAEQDLGTGPELWAYERAGRLTLTIHESLGHAMVRWRKITGTSVGVSTQNEDVRLEIAADVRYLVRRTFAEAI